MQTLFPHGSLETLRWATFTVASLLRDRLPKGATSLVHESVKHGEDGWRQLQVVMVAKKEYTDPGDWSERVCRPMAQVFAERLLGGGISKLSDKGFAVEPAPARVGQVVVSSRDFGVAVHGCYVDSPDGELLIRMDILGHA